MTILRNVRIADPSAAALASELNPGLYDVHFDRTINAIAPAGELHPLQPGDEEIDGSGKTLFPGLIDTHVHLSEIDAMVAAARAGVTTAVDLGTHPDSVIEKHRQATGIPAIISAGAAACAPGATQIVRMGFPETGAVTGPEDAERYLSMRVDAGSELIKIIIEDPEATEVPALDIPTLKALVDGAHQRGLLSVAHVVTANAFDRGLDAGVDILTHTPMDKVLAENTVARMVEQKTIASPTLVMMRNMANIMFKDKAAVGLNNAVESARAMHEAGVPIIAGTDANQTPMAPLPQGESLHSELDLLSDAGLSNVEVLVAATTGAAQAMRLTDRGRIGEGLRADLILVDGDPLQDRRVLRSPDKVWIAGVPAR